MTTRRVRAPATHPRHSCFSVTRCPISIVVLQEELSKHRLPVTRSGCCNNFLCFCLCPRVSSPPLALFSCKSPLMSVGGLCELLRCLNMLVLMVFHPHFRFPLMFTTSLSNSSLPNETWYCYCKLRNVFHPMTGRVCSVPEKHPGFEAPLFAHSLWMRTNTCHMSYINEGTTIPGRASECVPTAELWDLKYLGSCLPQLDPELGRCYSHA